MGQLDRKIVVITGGNQGIGKSIAKQFAAEGANLAIAARNADKLEAAANELREQGADVLAQPTDVSDGLNTWNSASSTEPAMSMSIVRPPAGTSK